MRTALYLDLRKVTFLLFFCVYPKPRLHEINLGLLLSSCCFYEVILGISVPWEFVLLKIYKSALNLKARLGGGYSDVNTHKGC